MKFTSAKTAIHYFFNHQWMRQEDDIGKLMVRVQYTAKGGNGSTWLGLELGDLVRPINHLKSKPKAWAMYAFAGDGHYTGLQYTQLVAHVISECRKECKISHPDDKTIRRLMNLARVTLEDTAQREITGKPKYTAAQICQRIDVPQSNWRKVWEKRMEIMASALSRLSAQALGPVYARMTEVSEQEEAA